MGTCAFLKAQNTYYEHFWDDKVWVYDTGFVPVIEHEAEDMMVALLTNCIDFPYLDETETYGVLVCHDVYNDQAWYGWDLGLHFQYYYNNNGYDVSLSAGDDEEDNKFCHLNYLLGHPDSCLCQEDGEDTYDFCGCRHALTSFCTCVEPYFEMTGFAGPYFPYTTVRIFIYRRVRPNESSYVPWA